MKKLALFISAGLTMAAAITAPALAWHPQGNIAKTVQDVTANSQTSSATDASSALTVAPGDTLLYTVVVSNTAEPAANHDNDMAYTVMTDQLPSGVELTSNPAQRQITENIGTIEPDKSVTKQYEVKVTDTKDGDSITNKACYTGDSIARDNPQSGCDTVVVTVRTPTLSCNLLSITQSSRSVTISKLDTTAARGAVFKNIDIDWGDHSTMLTTNSAVGQTHQYAADGSYMITATARFTVDGQDKTASSDGCTARVSFSTPQTLVNAGAGNALIPASLAGIEGYVLYLINLKRRARNS